jgi:hypothetical protein
MSYVMQASPLSKIFLFRDWQQKCIEDPDVIHSDEPFKVTIPRSAGAVTLEYRKPVHVGTLLPRLTKIHHKNGSIDEIQTRIQGDDELRNVVPWLTGGPDGAQFKETDRYGVVELPLDADYTTKLAEFMQQEALAFANPERVVEIQAARAEMVKDLQAKMKRAIESARVRADERVMRAIRSCFRNFYELNRSTLESGLGKVSPTNSEGLCAFVLKDVFAKAQEKRQAMMQNVMDMQSHIAAGGAR